MKTNKIEANQHIFGKLSDFVKDSGYEEQYYDKSLRFFIKTNEEEKDWLQQISFKPATSMVR